jgi:hypothetical protein
MSKIQFEPFDWRRTIVKIIITFIVVAAGAITASPPEDLTDLKENAWAYVLAGVLASLSGAKNVVKNADRPGAPPVPKIDLPFGFVLAGLAAASLAAGTVGCATFSEGTNADSEFREATAAFVLGGSVGLMEWRRLESANVEPVERARMAVAEADKYVRDYYPQLGTDWTGLAFRFAEGRYGVWQPPESVRIFIEILHTAVAEMKPVGMALPPRFQPEPIT